MGDSTSSSESKSFLQDRIPVFSTISHCIKGSLNLKELKDQTGYDDTWIVNWVGDGEAKQVNAQNPLKNLNFKLNINHISNSVDHTFELVSEETIKEHVEMHDAVVKIHKYVNHIKDSGTAREAFHKMLVDSGNDVLAVIRGTDNR